jgi:hypothetical protein
MKIPVETFEEHLEDGVLTWAFDHRGVPLFRGGGLGEVGV